MASSTILPEVHHGDAVAHVAHDGEVVGDEDQRQAELALQVAQQVQDLRLDRHVERGDRLVGDDHLRLQGERAGDADALPLAAGELVRVAVVVLGVQADGVHQLLDRPLALGRRPCACPWITNGSAMIEPTVLRGFSDEYGSWKIICISRRSAFSSSPLMCAISWPSKLIEPARGLHQPQQQPRGGRLAAAGLAHDPERLAAQARRSRRRRRPAPPRPGAGREPGADREVLDEAGDLDDLLAGVRLGGLAFSCGTLTGPSPP